jgi:hypothetical protein
MRLILSENKVKESISEFIKQSFPEVIRVDFTPIKVYLAHDDKSIERIRITVLMDPSGVLEGKSSLTDRNSAFKLYGHTELRRNIWQKVDAFFGLGLSEYGSSWDIEFGVIQAVKI